MAVEKGNTVKVNYTGTLEDGTVFDSSEKHGQPLEFEAGSGQVIKGFDDAVIGMEKGETKKVALKPSEAYGEPKPELTQKIPKDKIPKEVEAKEGTQLVMQLPQGQQIPARITEVGEKDITVDLNHPLAGKTLTFELTLESYE